MNEEEKNLLIDKVSSVNPDSDKDPFFLLIDDLAHHNYNNQIEARKVQIEVIRAGVIEFFKNVASEDEFKLIVHSSNHIWFWQKCTGRKLDIIVHSTGGVKFLKVSSFTEINITVYSGVLELNYVDKFPKGTKINIYLKNFGICHLRINNNEKICCAVAGKMGRKIAVETVASCAEGTCYVYAIGNASAQLYINYQDNLEE